MLSNTGIKGAKPKEKDYKIVDEKGMYLFVKKNGSKYFRLDYRFNGKRKTLAIGIYPETTLKQAREKRDKAKSQIAEGIDPMAEKKADSHDFKEVALNWFESKKHAIEEQTHKKKLRRFEKHVFPVIGHLTITKVKSPDVLNVVKPLIARKQRFQKVLIKSALIYRVLKNRQKKQPRPVAPRLKAWVPLWLAISVCLHLKVQ